MASGNLLIKGVKGSIKVSVAFPRFFKISDRSSLQFYSGVSFARFVVSTLLDFFSSQVGQDKRIRLAHYNGAYTVHNASFRA